MSRKVVHVVGTGTIGEPLIGLLCDFKEDLGIDELLVIIESEGIQELILATSSTVEGDATGMYIKDHIPDIKVSRISYGIPIGGELEYVDSNTIAQAIQGRTEV